LPDKWGFAALMGGKKMQKGESLGVVIGCVTGCVLSGVAIYFTQSIFCAVIPFACFLLGQRIGRAFDKTN